MGYTVSVDIWSLGVVVCELACGLNCYALAMNLPNSEGSYFHASTLTSYTEEEETTLGYKVEGNGTEPPATIVWQPGSLTEATTVSLASSSKVAQKYESEASSSEIKRNPDGQEGHELTHFLENYSEDILHPLYVGSALASELGERSGAWASGFSSTQQDQAWAAGTQTGLGSGLVRSKDDNRTQGEDYEDEEMAQAAFLLQAIAHDRRPAN
ncbi:hypothetical protein QQX98_006649 [Neonectria punicea]|uniref:Protein kinase domain-containing protein n=1 Tax=Neonectria punicea TaxID=979145 RepID=A0ABR1H057_9HYPO